MTDPVEKWMEAGARAARAFMLGADVWDEMDDRKKRLCIDQWRTGLRAFLADAEKDGYALVNVPEEIIVLNQWDSTYHVGYRDGWKGCRVETLVRKVEIAP